MHPHQQLIEGFYKAFQKKDFKTMQEAYHPLTIFTDPAFGRLSSLEVKAMWEMLLTASTDLELTFTCQADTHGGTCHWEPVYTFSLTGRKVHNIIDATFEFKDGKIFRHHDHFNFWRWSKMALGTPGLLLGWTPLIQSKVRAQAHHRLHNFIKSKTEKEISE